MRSPCSCPVLASIAVAMAVVGLDAAGIKVETEHDRKADFASLRSYAWLPTPPYVSQVAPDARDPRLAEEALDEPIRAAVDRVLAGKGFAASADAAGPDFHVVYYAAFGIGMNASVLGEHYGYLTGWGSPLLGTTATTSLRVLEEGTLVVDILRRDRTAAIWRGTATGAVDRSRTRKQRLNTIETAVRKMFAKFPSRR
jgi:uncharacterized protein DUF4136